ncbi:synaptotagmin-10-like [Limulus polyphemus]|uniref:Synaptotagmin-10-like n=1 Tax=Limulus polyphemus TaxID=6850 RepID=A0ABM1BE45_LIMPO|nr:synaptotagmin-10-like [Limulus polyphemus]
MGVLGRNETWNSLASALRTSQPTPETGYIALSQLIGAIIVLAGVILGVMTYFSYRWLISRLQPIICSEDGNSALLPPLNSPGAPSLKISHSLPDIKEELQKDAFWPDTKKEAPPRQTTLPTVPARHQTFQRQLSYRLELNNVPFEICHKPIREKASVGEIKPELYKKELVKEASIDTPEEEKNMHIPCGKLHFILKYDSDVEGLIVRVLRAQDLPPKDFFGTADPYLKISLLPERKKIFQTRVHRKNLNPVFNETFVFGGTQNQLRNRTLQFSLYDFSRHDLIGQVQVTGFGEICDIAHEVEYTMDIMCAPQEKRDLGELMLSLCYLPTAGRLTVTVLKARTLKATAIAGSSDPYVKVSLMCQGKRIKKKKTSVKKETLNPVYNEALVFDVPAENIEDVSLIVKVLNYDRVGTNEMMGCCAIGNGCIGLGRDHWMELLDSPRKPIAQWHPLAENIPSCLEPSLVKCISTG